MRGGRVGSRRCIITYLAETSITKALNKTIDNRRVSIIYDKTNPKIEYEYIVMIIYYYIYMFNILLSMLYYSYIHPAWQ